jgi:hypothetical protein
MTPVKPHFNLIPAGLSVDVKFDDGQKSVGIRLQRGQGWLAGHSESNVAVGSARSDLKFWPPMLVGIFSLTIT